MRLYKSEGPRALAPSLAFLRSNKDPSHRWCFLRSLTPQQGATRFTVWLELWQRLPTRKSTRLPNRARQDVLRSSEKSLKQCGCDDDEERAHFRTKQEHDIYLVVKFFFQNFPHSPLPLPGTPFSVPQSKNSKEQPRQQINAKPNRLESRASHHLQRGCAVFLVESSPW